MAIVVLFSTMSFTIDMHYCGDTLVDMAFLKEVKTCGMEMQQAASSPECSITKKGCCSDEQFTIEGQDELKISFDKLTLDQQLFVASFVYSYIIGFEELEEKPNSYNNYPPPLIVRNIQKLDEVYII